MAGVGPLGPKGEIPVAWSRPNERPPIKEGFVHHPHPHADAPRHHITLPVIETERLWLTGFHDGQLEAFTRIQYDPRVAEWFGGLPDPPHGAARQREETWRTMAMFLGHWALRGYGIWAVEEKLTGRFIGRAGLWNPEGWPGVEVGWLVDPDLWGAGYATEAGRAALDFAFAHLLIDNQALEQVISVTVPHNAASRRVMTKLGLIDTAERVQLRGHTQVLYRITREQWMADVRPPPSAFTNPPQQR